MSYIHYPRATAKRRSLRLPWLMFLLLSASFFFTYHDVTESHKALEDHNQSQDDLVTRVDTGSAVREVALLGLGAIGIVSLIRYPSTRIFQFEGLLGWLLLAFVIWACLSCFWATDLLLTLKRLASLGILTIAAIAVVKRFTVREFILWILFTTALFLVVGVAAELAFGAFRPFASGYRFAGTQHPNGEGIECGLLVLSGLVLAKIEKRRRWTFWTCSFVGFVFLLLSGSRTALVATLLAVTVYVAAESSRTTKTAILSGAGILFSALVLYLGVGSASAVKSAFTLGRDDADDVETFTGRTVIWQDVSKYIGERPVAGHGYGGFWNSTHISQVSDEEEWGVPDSHSAYVDYLLTIGVVGLALYVACLLAGLWHTVDRYRMGRETTYAYLAALLVFCIVHGLMESSIGEGSLLMFVCMVALIRVAYLPVQRTHRAAAERIPNGEVVCQS